MTMCVFCAVEPRTSPHSWEGAREGGNHCHPAEEPSPHCAPLFWTLRTPLHCAPSGWGSGPCLGKTRLVEPSLEMFHLQFPYRWLSRRAEEGDGRWIGFLVSSLGSQTELRWRGSERACNQFCSLCSVPSGHFSQTSWRGLWCRCWAERCPGGWLVDL